jgi:mono/diheme cytochrome c family protein
MKNPLEQDGHVSAAVRTEARRRDLAVKIALLALSVATIAVLIAAALKENILAPWRLHQRRYADILEAKATDDFGRNLAASFDVHMRQIVVPDLGAVDRCVSCHTGYDDPRMAEEPNPYRTHPGAYLTAHEDARFGCTICHRGQGRATDFEDAKAEDRHWDYPLLPLDLTQSACGICHTPTEVRDAGGEIYARGAQLFEAKGCRSCHRLSGLGGALGPALDNEGLKVKGQLPFANVRGPHTVPQWLEEHFDDPQGIVAGSQMPTPGLSRAERAALTTFVLSLQQRDLPGSYLSPEKHLEIYRRSHPEPRTGAQLYSELCSTCHDTGTYGRWDKFFGRFVPAVRGESFRANADPSFVAANIREGRQGTIMPAWGAAAGGLSETDIAALVGFLLDRPVLADELSTEPVAPGARSARGRADRGQLQFLAQCSSCHGPTGEGKLGPALNVPVLATRVTDEFLFRTIADGRTNTAMPAFLAPVRGGFAEQDIDDLVAYLRTLGSAPAVASAVLAEPR